MSAPVVSVCPDTALRRAIDLMLDAEISGLPVIDAQGALVGMVTEGDLLRRVETRHRTPHVALDRVSAQPPGSPRIMSTRTAGGSRR